MKGVILNLMKNLFLMVCLMASPLSRADADEALEIIGGLFAPRVIIAPPVVVAPPPVVYAPPRPYYPAPAPYFYGPAYGYAPIYPPYRHPHRHHRDRDDWWG